MVSLLRHHVNKDVLVSIPALFGSDVPFRCQLVGFELAGLWLRSDRLSQIALADGKGEPATTFVPYTQIAYLTAAPTEPPPASATGETPGRRRSATHAGTRKPPGR